MNVSIELPALLLQASRALVFLAAWMAFRSGFRYHKPWRISIFLVILGCYAFLILSPVGGPLHPYSNPPNLVNLILNCAFAVLFWRVSGYGELQEEREEWEIDSEYQYHRKVRGKP